MKTINDFQFTPIQKKILSTIYRCPGISRRELAEKAGCAGLEQEKLGEEGRMIVTPRDIDSNVRDVARLIGYGLNLALHPGLTVEDVDLFLG